MSEVAKHSFVYERNRINPAQQKDCLLRTDQVCGRLNCSRSMIYKLINQGDIKSVRVGKSYRISEKALHEYISNQQYKDIS